MFADLWWVWARLSEQTNTNKQTPRTRSTTPLFRLYLRAWVFLYWGASIVVITQLDNKQCLPWQKPLSLTGGHKASAVHLFKITAHSAFWYPRDTAKVTGMCVCMRFRKELLTVIFGAKCFWAEDTGLSCRRQIPLDLERRLELGKRGSEPSLHGFWQTRT